MINARITPGKNKLEDFRFTDKLGLFVADYAANTIFRRCGKKIPTLEEINMDLHNRLGIRIRFTPNHAWSAGATGWSNDVLTRVQNGDKWNLQGNNIPDWVHTCTQQWADILQKPTWQEAQL